MAYIVKFRGVVISGPFISLSDAQRASHDKHSEYNCTFPLSDFTVEKI